MSRFRKRLLLCGVTSLFALPILGLVVTRHVIRSRGERRLAEVMTALDADEPGWQIEPLYEAHNRTLPPPEENAAEITLSAARLIPTGYNEWRKKAKWWSELSKRSPRMPGPAEVREATAIREECEPALAVARTVYRHPLGGFRQVYAYPRSNPSPPTLELREVASLLDLDATVLAHAGRGDDAIRSAHAIIGVARGIGGDPALVSQLMRATIAMAAKTSAERTLAWSEPTVGLAELQAAFAAEATVKRMTTVIKGERAASFMLLDALDRGDIGSEVFLVANGPKIMNRATLAALRCTIPGQQAELLDLYGQLIKADQRTGPDRRAAIDAVTPPPNVPTNSLVNLMLPAMHPHMKEDDRARASLGAAAVGIACERYRQRFGRWPADLAAIPKDILPAVPDDPFTGGPLKYAALPDGVAAYSTWPDGVDHGGLNLHPTGGPSANVGFRLWNPDRRRQSAAPAPPPRTEGKP